MNELNIDTNKKEFEEISKQLFEKLTSAVAGKKVPSINSSDLDPAIAIWQDIRSSHIENGISVKETALLILSLKQSFAKYTANKNSMTNSEDLDILSRLIDFLGLIAFEIYSAEKEQLIDRQQEQISYLQAKRSDERFGNIIGNSAAMKPILKAITMVLDNDVTVLLEGESGTGKDVIANAIHQNSDRKTHPFITLNCGAIPKELIESELFGHEKGAFTGADQERSGKFELADSGTLFLDEIGELPLDMQTKLLRVIQNKEIERVGSSNKTQVDVRIIAATNKNLKEEVDHKRFRLDLFYRLNVFPIQIPPLRDRQEDIMPLAQHFLEKYAKEYNLDQSPLTKDAEQYLLKQDWEGNIRELENLISRATIMAQGAPISATLLQTKPGETEHLLLVTEEKKALPSPSISSNAQATSLQDIEKAAIENTLSITKGNIKKASEILGISRTTLYKKADTYGINLS